MIMNIQVKTLTEINEEALRVLYREMGVVDAVRFLRQFVRGYGDYTAERRQIFADESLDEIVRALKQHSTDG